MKAIGWAALLSISVLPCFAADIGSDPPLSAVGIQSRQYVDESRRNWQNTGPRPLATMIWYPAPRDSPMRNLFEGSDEKAFFAPLFAAADAKLAAPSVRRPLLVMSHGTGASAVMMMWLGQYFAARGYIVAAVNHHGNTAYHDKYMPQGFRLFWERPKDLSVLIDRLLADPVFGAVIDRSRIGAAGFSLGGYTVVALAGGRFNPTERARFCASSQRDFTCGPQPEFPAAEAELARLAKDDAIVQESLRHATDSYRDERVRAVFAMAPVLGSGFTRDDVRDVRIPVRIVAGDHDAIVPPPANALRFAQLIPQTQLTLLPGGVSHYTFLAECAPQATEAICKDEPGVDRTKVHTQVAWTAFEFFEGVWARQDEKPRSD
jgi:predicted dienelactone hydrolase